MVYCVWFTTFHQIQIVGKTMWTCMTNFEFYQPLFNFLSIDCFYNLELVIYHTMFLYILFHVVVEGFEPPTAKVSVWNSTAELYDYIAPWVNYDITTYRLTVDCSASELPRNVVEERGIQPLRFLHPAAFKTVSSCMPDFFHL